METNEKSNNKESEKRVPFNNFPNYIFQLSLR